MPRNDVDASMIAMIVSDASSIPPALLEVQLSKGTGQKSKISLVFALPTALSSLTPKLLNHSVPSHPNRALHCPCPLPSLSNCVTRASTQLFTALPSPTTLSLLSATVVTSTGSNGAVVTFVIASLTPSGSAAGTPNVSNGAAPALEWGLMMASVISALE